MYVTGTIRDYVIDTSTVGKNGIIAFKQHNGTINPDGFLIKIKGRNYGIFGGSIGIGSSTAFKVDLITIDRIGSYSNTSQGGQRTYCEIERTNIVILTAYYNIMRLIDHTSMTLIRSITVANNISTSFVVPFSKVIFFIVYSNNSMYLYKIDEIPCPEGWYFPGGSNLCSQCDPNCLECTTNSTTCTKCKIQGTLSGSVCQYCGIREYWGGASCLPCSASDCKNCFDNPTKCFDCELPKLFNEASNNCRDCPIVDTYNNGTTCAQCDIRCADCDTQGICLVCQTNYILRDNICLCPPGFFINGIG